VVGRINRCPRLKTIPARSHNQPGILLMARGRTAGRSLRHVLELGGYAVLPARDCREAVSLFLTSSIDLVLLDLRGPVLHGLATFKLLHAYDPRVPFVVMAMPPVDLTAFDHNSCHTILERPFHAAKLLRVLRDILDQRAQRLTRPGQPEIPRHSTTRHHPQTATAP